MTFELPIEEPEGAPHDSRSQILALSGGGFRGLFTARILEHLEALSQCQCGKMFDVLAGTSVGGIIAIGLALEIPAKEIRGKIAQLGPFIFRKRHLGAGWVGSRYSQAALRGAIAEILGDRAGLSLREIRVPLVVTAVDPASGAARVIRSSGFSGRTADDIPLLDLALATSAAPIYFPIHYHQAHPYLDGGLVANAPDLIAVTESINHFGVDLNYVYLLSVGTAQGSLPTKPRRIRAPGNVSWVVRHRLFDIVSTAQESLAMEQVAQLLGRRLLRLDALPPSPIRLDAADNHTASMLIQLADSTMADLTPKQRENLAEFLRHRTL